MFRVCSNVRLKSLPRAFVSSAKPVTIAARITAKPSLAPFARRFSSDAQSPKKESNTLLWGAIALAVVSAGAYYTLNSSSPPQKAVEKVFVPTAQDYQNVYNAIANKLDSNPGELRYISLCFCKV